MALNIDRLSEDTIAAIATAAQESGIGIIRVSGPDAFAVATKLFRTPKGIPNVDEWKANTIHYGYLIDPEHEERKIDEVLVSIFRAPHSFTTEDTIEINTHGGVYLEQKILELVLSCGVRMAEPGEFTKRAFLGGRIDLSKAEAIMNLISAQNEFARKTSMDQLQGSVSAKVKELREKILYEIAFIESALDDPENYDTEGYPQKLRKVCDELSTELTKLIDYSNAGMVLREGIHTVIVGKPNAGKSSLLNFLSGKERAIVTDVAGTTRDILEESVRLHTSAGDILLKLVDTAGIHETEDKVEKIGVDRAKKALESAQLILFLIDMSGEIAPEDKEIAALVNAQLSQGKHGIVLLNKSDLNAQIQMEDVRSLFDVSDDSLHLLTCSLATGEGTTQLQETIVSMFHAGEIVQRSEVFLSNERERHEAELARDSILQVMKSIDLGMSEDFFSSDLMDAFAALGRIIGEAVEDDLVEEIFTKFCLGK